MRALIRNQRPAPPMRRDHIARLIATADVSSASSRAMAAMRIVLVATKAGCAVPISTLYGKVLSMLDELAGATHEARRP